MKKRQILLLLVCVISACLFGLTACGLTGKDPTHVHDLEHIAEKNATCAESGNIEYWYCKDCDKYFADVEAEKEITQAETSLEASAHIYGEWQTVTPATCTTEGKQEKICSVCGDKVTETLPKLGHKYDEWITVKEATCGAEGQKKRTCSVCNETETEAIPMLTEHKYGEWTTVTAATCTTEGKQEKTCSVCGDKQTQTLPKVAHTYGEWTTTPATCTTDGNKEKVCSVCGDKVTETLPKLGHKYGEWITVKEATCGAEGQKKRTCSVCNETETEAIPMLTEHTYGEWTTVTAATCTTEGKQEKTCSVCGDKVTETLPKLGHKYGEWTTVKEATCATEGTQERTCQFCGDTQSKALQKTDHVYGDWVTVKEPTCKEEGIQERRCINCKEAPVEQQTLPKVDHKYGEWTTVIQATCFEQGVLESVCEYCGDTQTKYLPLTDHECDETGHCVHCGELIFTPECKHENVHMVEVEGGHRTICDNCNTYLSEIMAHTFLDNEYSWEEIDGEQAHGRKCIECGANVLEKCTIIGPVYKEYYNGTEEINHKCHVWYCSVCKCPSRDGELHSFYRSEEQSNTAICEECGYNLCVYQGHAYDGGVCRFCGHKCPHENVMGMQTSHLSYNGDTEKMVHNFECQDCGSVEEECTFDNGICTVCRGQCEHTGPFVGSGYVDQGSKHSCVFCGLLLDHEYSYIDSGAHCIYCRHECTHENVVDCRCTVCKSPLHNYGDLLSDDRGHYRICSVCNIRLQESDHDFDEFGKCKDCGYIDQTIATCVHESSDRYVSREGGHRAICKKCEMEYGEILPHVEGEDYFFATNGEGHQKGCLYCYEGMGEVLPHVYDQDVNDREAICSVCYATHQHSYDSETGVCFTCNYTCKHSGSFLDSQMEGHRCEFCYKAFEHTYDSNGNCTVCGYYCQHQGGFTDGTCDICGFICPHLALFNPMNEKEHECAFCHLSFPHNYDSNGNCMQCYAPCPHRYVSVNESMHRCEICNREEMHVCDAGMPCYFCGYQCAHKNYMEFVDHCECSDCHVVFPHGEEPCIMCGKVQSTACDHSFGFGEGTEQGHPCNRCGEILPHNCDELGNCFECGYKMPCEHDFSGNAFAPTEEGHVPMCVKCGASGEIIPHSQGGYHAEPGNDGHKTYCAVCGYPYGELLPHVVESDGSGLCSLCGERHEHSYSGETCTTCNHTCSHTAAGGRDCGNESYHLCGYCNAEMPHDFSGDMNMCMQCGYQKSTQA